MRSKLFHLLTLASSLMLCQACAESLDPGDALLEPQPLVFTASQGGDLTLSTRAAADGTWDGDGTEFVAIKIGSEVKKYKVTSSNGALEPVDSDNTFYRSDKNDIQITAWYPYVDNQSELPAQPSIATDQSEKANREASNLMTASATAKFGETTRLTFTHKTALIKLHILSSDGTSAVAGATVKVLEDSTTPTWITAYNASNGDYSALISPQSVSSGTEFISINADGKNYVYKLASETNFTAGNSYAYSLTLEKPGDYFWVEAVETVTDGITVSMNSTSGPAINLLYSTDGSTWQEFTVGSTTVTLSKAGDKVWFKAGSGGNTQLSSAYNAYNSFSFSGKVKVGGDITTLLSAAGAVSDLSNYGTRTFYNLFNGNTNLISAENLSLPSTTLADCCYSGLFSGCTSLTVAPALPATSLALQCYMNMFNGCTSLTAAQKELPATILADQCYQGMFQGCTKLKTAPNILAETFANYCCQEMFSGCTGLATAPTMTSARTLAQYCCWNMFKNCTALEVAPALPATTLAENCYQSMFSGCTNLATAPALPATTLAERSYFCMFYGCTSLATAPTISATELDIYCCYQMFQNCTSLKTAPTLSAKTLEEKCYYGMFQGCTLLTEVPTLSAETLAVSCYEQMFRGCTKLTTAPTLSATTLANRCCSGMFSGCTALTIVQPLLAETLAGYCYSRMFSGCTSLKTAPTISAKTLATNCYYGMFSGCTALETAPTLSVETLETYCYQEMFKGCTSLKTAPDLPAATLETACYQDMFNGCTNLTTAPTISATTLSSFCCKWMFKGCTSLKTAPDLNAKTLAESCYEGMFSGCTSLTTAPTISATKLDRYCCQQMFKGCTSLQKAPDLNASTLCYYCYQEMFSGCTSLNSVTIKATSDDSPATSLKNWLPTFDDTTTERIIYKKSSFSLTVPNGWTTKTLTT